MVSAHHRLGTRLGVLHRFAQLPGDQSADELLGRHLQLAAEPAADIRRDDPHLVLGDAQRQGKQRPQDVRYLRRGPQRHALAVRLHDGRPGFQKGRDEPLLDEPALDGDLSGFQHVLDRLAGASRSRLENPGVGAVRLGVRVDQRGAVGQRGLHVQDDRQRLVVDIDGFECVLGGVLVAGDDDGHGLAHMVNLVDGEARVARVDHVVRHGPGARDVARVSAKSVRRTPRRRPAGARQPLCRST